MTIVCTVGFSTCRKQRYRNLSVCLGSAHLWVIHFIHLVSSSHARSSLNYKPSSFRVSQKNFKPCSVLELQTQFGLEITTSSILFYTT
jgi:hypothetical protein